MGSAVYSALKLPLVQQARGYWGEKADNKGRKNRASALSHR